jgi:hypothetical protein
MLPERLFLVALRVCIRAAGGTRKISVAFAPTAVGTVSGTLSVTDNGAGSPQKVALTGTGT